MSTNFELGDLVWAKRKGCSIWPGKIAEPLPSMRSLNRKDIQCVYFFGTNNYAWVEENKIKPYKEYKSTYENLCKSVQFKNAVSAIEAYTTKKLKFPDMSEEQLVKFDEDTLKLDVHKSPDNKSKEKQKLTPSPKLTSSSSNNGAKRPISDKSERSLPKRPRSTIPNEERNNPIPLPPLPSKAYEMSCLIEASSEDSQIDAKNSTDLNSSDTSNVKTIGFIGLGAMGAGIVRNLIRKGHKMVIWNRSPDKYEDFIAEGSTNVKMVLTPSDVIEEADITFSCVEDSQAAKDLVFENCGILHAKEKLLNQGKCYVEMTGIDPSTSKQICEEVNKYGVRYLEAQIQGNKTQAEEGFLVLLTAGDKTVFTECTSCFQAMCKTAMHLGEVGNATKFNLIMQLFHGVALVGLAEGMALADKAGLTTRDVMEVLQLTTFACPFFIEKGKYMTEMSFSTPRHALKHLQKDLKMVMDLADESRQEVPLASQANSVLTHARRIGYGDYDSSAVFLRSRF